MATGTIMERSGRSRLPALLTLTAVLLAGCAGDRSDVGFGDVLAGVTGAVGAATAIVGIRGGNAQVTQQGINAMQQAAAVVAAPQMGVRPDPVEDDDEDDEGDEGDLDAVARQCSARAERLYPAGPQNQSLMSAACIYHCAHVATGIDRYRTLYLESQRRANSLCSITISPTCNEISTAACRI